VTQERLDKLAAAVNGLARHIGPMDAKGNGKAKTFDNGPIGRDVEPFRDRPDGAESGNADEIRIKETIFRNVAELDLIRKTLAGARAAGKLADIPEDKYQAMQTTLQGYHESLSMAEFKRYRLKLDGMDVVNSIERVKKALQKQGGKTSEDPLYGP